MGRRFIGAAAATAALAVTGASAAPRVLVTATFRGRTSQHESVAVRYARRGHTGYVTVTTRLRGRCRSPTGTQSRLSTRVSVRAHGRLPIPSHWGFIKTTATYSVTVSARTHAHRKVVAGEVSATWKTAAPDRLTCRARADFSASRRHRRHHHRRHRHRARGRAGRR